MGTCNYITQSDFDLYIIEEVGNETYEELELIYNEAKWLATSLNNELTFYKIIITEGYYVGLQTFIQGTEWQIQTKYFEELSNEDCHYYFGMCRSKAIRKHKAEVNRINKKLLPLFKKKLGFDHIRCVGVFSNGEAIYERIK